MDDDNQVSHIESSIALEENNSANGDLELYSRNQITTAALIGGPIAGTYLAYTNLKKLNKIQESIGMAIIGATICITFEMITFMLPDGINFTGINVAIAIIIRSIAMQFLKPEMTTQFKIGQKKERWFKVVKISLIIAAAYICASFGLHYIFNES
jgi:hypothetical protein